MISQQKKLKNNKKLRVFLLFLLIALLFWMLIKLSREYTGEVTISLKYKDLPKNKLLQTDPIHDINVTLKTIGFNLLKNKISKKKITISLEQLRRKNQSIYYYTSSDIFSDVGQQFSKAEVISVKPDTIFFDLGKSISKKLRVIPNIKIEYQTGYNMSGDLSIDPKEITISGPQSQIDSIVQIRSKFLELKNVHESVDEELNIDINENFPKIKYSHTKVRVKGLVEKFTERTIKSKFRIINKPGAYKMITFPKEVDLVFQIGLSDFNKINENDFSVVCDYRESESNDINYLIPKLTGKPGIVKDVKIIPSKIEFLLEK